MANKFATSRTAVIATLTGVIAIISVISTSLLHAQMAPVIGVLTTLVIGAAFTLRIKG